jgi:hypothetical protein
MSRRFSIALILIAAAGCTSHIVPLRPVERVEEWVADDVPATLAATETASATETAPATAATAEAPATRPGRMVVRIIDPNETSRFIYKASYDNIWRQANGILTAAGFALDLEDYRRGEITSHPLPSAQIVEFWKPQHVDITDSLENTVNNQRRTLRLRISKVEGKPDFYQIGIQVLVERETNPTENIGGPLFVEGSGFGRNALSLRSDYAEPNSEPGRWVRIGHDPTLERKLMDELFNRI